MGSPPLWLTPVPVQDIERGDGRLVDAFTEGYCRITKESLGGHAGELLRLRPWQSNTSSMTFARTANGRLRHRLAVIGLPRKNGKSAIGSAYGLNALVMGDEGSEVYSCAGGDKDQAKIVFNVAKRMVELDPDLSKIIKPYRDYLVYTEKDSIYKALSCEAFTKEGLNPTTVVFDELHAAPNSELFDVMTLAQGARRDPLLIVISTAGTKSDKTGQDSTLYRLYQDGIRICNGEDDDDSFFMAWWGAPEGADHRDPAVWEAANPGFGDLIDPRDFASNLKRVHENEFRTKRLNQWVNAAKAWLPAGAWDARYSDREFMPSARGVVLGFDGSKSNDCTALVAVTVDQKPQVKVLGLWEKPQGDAGDSWRVPRETVKDTIRQACRDYQVREIAWDEWLWQDAAEELTDEGLPIVVFPQTLTRMGPATSRFYEHVVNSTIEQDGNPSLARHFGNAQLKTDSRGSRLAKDAKGSPRKIDLAIATVMATDRAGFWLTQPLEGCTKDGTPLSKVKYVW